MDISGGSESLFRGYGRSPVPGRMRSPFVVGSNCAIFGTPCGGGHPSYRSVAPLHTVAALRFPAPSGPPIAPLPRNRLAFSAAGGASPLSSSPQNPLRWVAAGDPAFLKKRMRRARWKRKSLLPHNRPCGPVGGNAWVFRIGAGKTCRSPTECGVHWLLSGLLRRSSQNPGSHRWVENRKACPPTPAHSASLCATRAVPKERCPAFLNCQGAAAKENGGASGRDPEFRWCQERIQEAKPANLHRAKTPVTGAASVPDEVRNAARAFFSYTIKRRILFFLGKREWGF